MNVAFRFVLQHCGDVEHSDSLLRVKMKVESDQKIRQMENEREHNDEKFRKFL